MTAETTTGIAAITVEIIIQVGRVGTTTGTGTRKGILIGKRAEIGTRNTEMHIGITDGMTVIVRKIGTSTENEIEAKRRREASPQHPTSRNVLFTPTSRFLLRRVEGKVFQLLPLMWIFRVTKRAGDEGREKKKKRGRGRIIIGQGSIGIEIEEKTGTVTATEIVTASGMMNIIGQGTNTRRGDTKMNMQADRGDIVTKIGTGTGKDLASVKEMERETKCGNENENENETRGKKDINRLVIPPH
jgi:hypothetical protein